jgi:hypothetical protein
MTTAARTETKTPASPSSEPVAEPAPSTSEHAGGPRAVRDRKSILLRVDPAVYDALARWASDELRSTTAQIELLLRRSLQAVGRLPANAADMPRRGRPPRAPDHRVDTDGQSDLTF